MKNLELNAIDIINDLLCSDEPAVKYMVRAGAMGEDPNGRAMKALRREVAASKTVKALLRGRTKNGRLPPVNNVYKKWDGAHWVLAALAEIGYPPRDESLRPLRDQVVDAWLAPSYHKTVDMKTKAAASRRQMAVPVVNGRARRCASQQSNALWSSLVLGFRDEKCDALAALLMKWQWPDGGWNCDRRPEAATSSFWESILPLRALAHYARETGSAPAREAALRAAELFLSRRLFLRRRDGAVMNPQFTRLHFPRYWRYDILLGLKVMAEAELIGDERCAAALDLLEEKRLPDGGWPAEEKFYNPLPHAKSARERVNWGGVSKRRMNPWVTADALYVLRAAGRLEI